LTDNLAHTMLLTF